MSCAPGVPHTVRSGRLQANLRPVSVALDEHTITVYDANTPIAAVLRRGTTDLNRTKAKHQITARLQP